jgi:hypothetical protein
MGRCSLGISMGMDEADMEAGVTSESWTPDAVRNGTDIGGCRGRESFG